jgi:hypothetical protein
MSTVTARSHRNLAALIQFQVEVAHEKATENEEEHNSQRRRKSGLNTAWQHGVADQDGQDSNAEQTMKWFDEVVHGLPRWRRKAYLNLTKEKLAQAASFGPL